MNSLKMIKGNSYSTKFQPEELGNCIGKEVVLYGSIYKIRRMSGFAFLLLRTRRQVIQCVYSEAFSQFSLEGLREETCVELTGLVVAEERSRTGWELQALELKILSAPAEEIPLVIHNKQIDTSLENRLDYRPVTLRNEKERAIFQIQAAICEGIRSFLSKEHFTEVHTPKIVYAGAEGGANIFHLNYFGRDAYLAQSPQFYKQMMVGVLERVYEIGPVFRAEKHDTSRHLNEYTSVDLEMGYIESFEEIMELEQRMLTFVMEYLKHNCPQELALWKVSVPEITAIPALRFREAKEWVAESYHRPIIDNNDFEPEEEKLLCELVKVHTGSDFVFVTHYPSSKRPFYAMEDNENPEETLSFDLLFRGLEITTGGQRIHNYQEQVAKMERRGMNLEQFDSYLMMHRYGMPPHGGMGLGLERLTARLLGLDNVRLASLFPRDIHRLIP